jgi:hypothetical protein
MNLNQDERGVVSVLLISLVVLLLMVAGVAIYNVHKTRTTNEVTKGGSLTPIATATPTPVPGSDTALILAAASKQCTTASNISNGATIDNTPDIIGDAAQVGVHCNGTQGGFVDILKKANGVWTIVYTGQDAPSHAIGLQYSLPTSWYDAK